MVNCIRITKCNEILKRKLYLQLVRHPIVQLIYSSLKTRFQFCQRSFLLWPGNWSHLSSTQIFVYVFMNIKFDLYLVTVHFDSVKLVSPQHSPLHQNGKRNHQPNYLNHPTLAPELHLAHVLRRIR